MTPPRLIGCYFGKSDIYERMARVLIYTARKHCAGWDVQIQRIAPPEIRDAHHGAVPSHVFNTQKMEAWYQAVEACADGDRVCLIDADTMILRPLDDIWDRPFDYAYTTKNHRFPFNSGVMFLRVSPRIRAFVQVWRDENRRMLREYEFHMPWRAKFGGINQASLGYALQSGLTRELAILELPCLEWNCEDTCWDAYDPEVTRIVHIKSQLRRAVFENPRRAARLLPLVTRWRQLELDARGVTA